MTTEAAEQRQWEANQRWFAEHAGQFAELASIDRARAIARRANPQYPLWCESCGDRSPKHRHHPDYDEPARIIWLCVFCHRRVHPRGKWAAIWRQDALGVKPQDLMGPAEE